MKPISQSQYVDEGGCNCPACGEQDLHPISKPVWDSGRFFQGIGCATCKATWLEEYKLTAYYNLEVQS
jgi:transposase-like protein